MSGWSSQSMTSTQGFGHNDTFNSKWHAWALWILSLSGNKPTPSNTEITIGCHPDYRLVCVTLNFYFALEPRLPKVPATDPKADRESSRQLYNWANLPLTKLLPLRVANRIVVVESNLKSEFDRRITTIGIPMILIESMIAISIKNWSIFDINLFKSIIFDILLIKRSI